MNYSSIENCLLNVAHMDEIVSIDPKTNKVRVGAGATVSALLDALRRHNLTLQNLASITDQQVEWGLTVDSIG